MTLKIPLRGAVIEVVPVLFCILGCIFCGPVSKVTDIASSNKNWV